MGLRRIQMEMSYWTFDDEENNLVVDGVVLGLLEARALAQSLIMTSKEAMPPPRIEIRMDINGVLTKIDPDVWQEARAREAEEKGDDGNGQT